MEHHLYLPSYLSHTSTYPTYSYHSHIQHRKVCFHTEDFSPVNIHELGPLPQPGPSSPQRLGQKTQQTRLHTFLLARCTVKRTRSVRIILKCTVRDAFYHNTQPSPQHTNLDKAGLVCPCLHHKIHHGPKRAIKLYGHLSA